MNYCCKRKYYAIQYILTLIIREYLIDTNGDQTGEKTPFAIKPFEFVESLRLPKAQSGESIR